MKILAGKTASRFNEKPKLAETSNQLARRLKLFRIVMLIGFFIIIVKLFFFQVISASWYTALASNQHDVFAELFPERGTVFARDPVAKDNRFPIAINKQTAMISVNPAVIKDAKLIAANLAPILQLSVEELEVKLSRTDTRYVILAKGLNEKVGKQVADLKIKGVDVKMEFARFYPDANLFSQVLGFVGPDTNDRRVGRYGVEGFMNKALYGEAGFLMAERDPMGQLIGTAARSTRVASDGADITLTINRAVQFAVCNKLKDAVVKTGAASGTVVVEDPKTGAILAMCNYPDFDANNYSRVDDIAIYNNMAVFTPYETGSVFKPLVIAAAIDAGKIAPNTTFVDIGSIKIGPDTIRNADGKIYGLQTMTQVLENSVNTGMVYISKLLGNKLQLAYLEKFGFGAKTGIEINTEAVGNISALKNSGEIWGATASFGQGISATPLQLVAAYAAIANGGIYMKPYIVDAIDASGNEIKTTPQAVRQVVSSRAALQTTGMLISVVENGHGKRAKVSGYYVAGKTGTAEIPKRDGRGYEKDAAIGSFAGFAPAYNPVFAMVVKLDRPQGVIWAESTAAPLFGDIADYLLQYYQIPPERK